MSETARARVLHPVYGGACATQFDEDRTVVAIPFTLPGEYIEAGLPSRGRGRDPFAELLHVIEPSAERVEPRCRHFGTCGGCQYQHASAEAQLAIKREVLEQTLSKAGVKHPVVNMHAAEPWHYRNRIRLRVVAGKIGYSRRSSNDFLPITECPITSPLLWHAAEATLDLTQSGKVCWPEATSEIEMFTDAQETQLQASFHLDANVATVDRSAPQQFRELCAHWKERVPQLTGAGLLVAAAPVAGLTKRVQESRRVEIAQWGERLLRYEVGGRRYDVTRDAFFQVNRFLTERMIELVVGKRDGGLVFDLFAGAGLFSLPLTDRFKQVIAVEIGEPAVSDLSRALNGLGGMHRAEHRTTLDFLRASASFGTPDLIVMDPPRAGLGDAVVRALLQVAAPEMVYVSCDPVTFARDARALLQSGYTLTELHLLDLFPQTFHMETIAVFHR